MSKTQPEPSTDEMTEPADASGAPDYLAWVDIKIRRAIADDDANPEGRATLETVKKRHGAR